MSTIIKSTKRPRHQWLLRCQSCQRTQFWNQTLSHRFPPPITMPRINGTPSPSVGIRLLQVSSSETLLRFKWQLSLLSRWTWLWIRHCHVQGLWSPNQIMEERCQKASSLFIATLTNLDAKENWIIEAGQLFVQDSILHQIRISTIVGQKIGPLVYLLWQSNPGGRSSRSTTSSCWIPQAQGRWNWAWATGTGVSSLAWIHIIRSFVVWQLSNDPNENSTRIALSLHPDFNLSFFFQIGLGSATEGILKVGDRIHAINHRDASKLTHVEAQNIFKKAGTSVQLTVSR